MIVLLLLAQSHKFTFIRTGGLPQGISIPTQLMENHKYALTMQEEMIREIESACPEYLVFVNVATSWLWRQESEGMIFEWFKRYQENYNLVGVIDILAANRTDYYWDEKAVGYSAKSKYWLCVLRRKNQV